MLRRSTRNKKQVAQYVNDVAPGPSRRAPVKRCNKRATANQAAGHLSNVGPAAGPAANAGPVNANGALAAKVVNVVVPKEFHGSPSNHGSSIEKPVGATLDVPWPCAKRDCTTGLTWHPRAQVGRKTISHFFGKNKEETNQVNDDVWHYYCRKHYQRDSYAAGKTPDLKAAWELDNIRKQLVRIRLWRPNAQFTIQLTKGMGPRIELYSAIVVYAVGAQALTAALQEAAKLQQTYSKTGRVIVTREDLTHPVIAKAFDADCCKPDANIADCITALDWVSTRRANNTITHVPPFEFLLHGARAGEVINDPAGNHDQWIALLDAPAPVVPAPVAHVLNVYGYPPLPLYVPPRPIVRPRSAPIKIEDEDDDDGADRKPKRRRLK